MSSFAFTITLKPNIFKVEPEKQYDATYKHVHTQLSTICNKVSLVAELTKNMNVHYHGVLTTKLANDLLTKKQFHKLFRNDLIVGFVNIRIIDNHEVWNQYITKSLQDTYTTLSRRPIIDDDLLLFTNTQHALYSIQW